MTTLNGTVGMNKQEMDFTSEQIEDLCDSFESIDSNGNGSIQLGDLHRAFEVVGIKLPQYRIRDLVSEHFRGMQQTATLSMETFKQLYGKIATELDPKFKEKIKRPQNVQQIQGMSEASNDDILHTIRNEEQVAFANWINSNLISDVDLAQLLPVSPLGDDLYTKVADGRILCKLINSAVPETIDERAVNKKHLNAYTKIENVTLALNSARAIGVCIVNIDADDIIKGKQHLVLALLWQIIRIGLFRDITLRHVPGLVRLLKEGETQADLQRLPPEQILLRWANYHLEQAGIERRLTNFTIDVVDSEIYTHLLKQIAPMNRAVTLDPLKISGDNIRRAESMLVEADKLECRAFVTAADVVKGVYKLNLAFVANLFNTWPALNPPTAQELDELPSVDLEEIEEETREERTYRNWMNSVGVDPFVNWLYSDLGDGNVICQVYDVIKPGHVDWKRVVTKYKKFGGMMDQIQNCNYAIDLGKKMGYSLVGIQGKDIYDGNKTLTLGLVWQLMRSYTLTLLAQCAKSGDHLASDKEILDWANQKLKTASKRSTVSSFQDQRLSDARVIIDLIDAIHPNVIDHSIVRDALTNEDKLANAKYAITTARKIGAKVYALPEDILEVKPKMLLTVFACLMARDYQSHKTGLPPVVPKNKSTPPPVPAKPLKACPIPNGHQNGQEKTETGVNDSVGREPDREDKVESQPMGSDSEKPAGVESMESYPNQEHVTQLGSNVEHSFRPEAKGDALQVLIDQDEIPEQLQDVQQDGHAPDLREHEPLLVPLIVNLDMNKEIPEEGMKNGNENKEEDGSENENDNEWD